MAGPAIAEVAILKGRGVSYTDVIEQRPAERADADRRLPARARPPGPASESPKITEPMGECYGVRQDLCAGWRQMSATGVYPANLCPLSSGVDFPCLGEDFGQSVGESIKAASGRAVWQGTPEHLDGVLSEQEGIGNTIQACPG